MLPVVDSDSAGTPSYFTAYGTAVRMTAQACIEADDSYTRGTLDKVSASYVCNAWREYFTSRSTPMPTVAIPASRTAPRGRMTNHAGVSLDVTPPYRPVDLSRFPTGTRVIPIDQSEHVALAALTDALHVTHHDAARFLAVADPGDAKVLIHTHARFLYELSQIGLQGLPDGHLKAWHPRALLDAPSDLNDGVPRMVSLAATEVGLASLALQWASVAYVRALSMPDATEEGTVAMLARQITSLDRLREAAFTALLSANQRMTMAMKLPPRSHTSQAVFRSLQYTVPVLALVPLIPPSARARPHRP